MHPSPSHHPYTAAAEQITGERVANLRIHSHSAAERFAVVDERTGKRIDVGGYQLSQLYFAARLNGLEPAIASPTYRAMRLLATRPTTPATWTPADTDAEYLNSPDLATEPDGTDHPDLDPLPDASAADGEDRAADLEDAA